MATIVLNGNTMGYSYGLESFKSVTTALNKSKSTATSLAEKISHLNNGLSTYNARGTGANSNIAKAQEAVESGETKSNRLAEAVSTIDEKTEALLDTAVEVDNKVAKLINSKKKSFYKKYPHLKPECERSWAEKAWDHISNGIHSGVQFFSDIGNAIKNFVIDIGKWISENLVALGTALVVILAAALVVIITPLSLPFVAAIAGLLVISTYVADIICMIANEGKGIAEMLDESGYHTLSQVFTGFQWGCDIVEIAFPIGAAVKCIKVIGIKKFATTCVATIKKSLQECFEKVFRSGFKDGVKNAITTIAKNILFDWDDLPVTKTKISPLTKNSKIDIIDNRIFPKTDDAKEIFKKYNIKSIGFSEDVDWKAISVFEVDISAKDTLVSQKDVMKYLSGEMSESDFSKILRQNGTYKQANENLQLITGKNLKESNLQVKQMAMEKFGLDTAPRIAKHDHYSGKKMFYIPDDIHRLISHNGAITMQKTYIKQASQLVSNIPSLNKAYIAVHSALAGVKAIKISGITPIQGICNSPISGATCIPFKIGKNIGNNAIVVAGAMINF